MSIGITEHGSDNEVSRAPQFLAFVELLTSFGFFVSSQRMGARKSFSIFFLFDQDLDKVYFFVS